MKKKTRSPQEKKSLSYQKDGRNAYGKSVKAARKAIPLRKKLANRAVRRSDKVNLLSDPEFANAEIRKNLKSRWKKAPDQRLGDYIEDANEKK